MQTLAILAVLAALGAAPPRPTPEPPAPPVTNRIDDGQVRTDLWQHRVPAPGAGGSGTGAGGTAGVANAPLAYTTTPACAGTSAESPTTDLCGNAVAACREATSGPGFLTYVYARPATGGPWALIGSTCYPDEAITDEQRRQLTLADVQHAFATTPFASPAATIQPPGGQTLVTLPIYYATEWSADGYRPDQIRTVQLLGRTVDLRIALDSYTYDHGDGTLTGPTTSPGGPYPDGDITHAYPEPGVYTPAITARLTASYRIDGGAWAPIQSTATRRTVLPRVTVHTATNRLRAG